MNQNVNEAESFAADFVASEEGLLFFEVPKVLVIDAISIRKAYGARS
jgi:hypothetical protein